MDDERGERHPERIGLRLMRYAGWMGTALEIMFHSRFLAKRYGTNPSRLCWADKLGTAMYPVWLWVLLATLTGEVREYMDQRKYEIHLGIEAAGDTPWEFFRRYKALAHKWAREI